MINGVIYLKHINDYIVVFESVMTHALCDSILEEFKNEDEWGKTVVGGGRIDETIRTAETIIISYPHVIEKNKKVRQKLDKYVFASAGLAIKKYNEKFSLAKIEEDSGYELLRYKEGQFYTQHTDSFKARPRAVSCSFALNDDYEGGEWGFFDREMVIKAPKGSAVLFPSNFMYPHEIMPVTKGTRYSVITWFI
jgi:predicted 2-oxoglutarate/Fe(II)-dependent dioxygenase YbiX